MYMIINETIDLLNSKFGEILCSMVDERLSDGDKNALLQLSFHIRQLTDMTNNCLAAQYVKDDNLERMYFEMLDSKLTAALEYVNRLIK